MRHSLLLAFLAAPVAAQSAGAPVVINEFSYDDSSADDREFVELFNATNTTIDISNWVLDSEDQVGPNTAYTIPASTMLPAGAYYVLGSALVPNVNQIVGTTNLWENDQESLTLRDATGAVVDTLVYEANKGLWPTALPEGEGIWGNFTSIDSSTIASIPILTSWSRVRDGLDSGNNGNDFVLAPSTPGASNTGGWLNLPYSENFDFLTADQPLPNSTGSFEFPYVVDPTIPGTILPSWLPASASPQGGNCMALWDTSGGGDSGMLTVNVDGNVVLECYAYFDAGPEASVNGGTSSCLTTANTFEYQTWSVGFGRTGTYHNSPDPSGQLAAGFGGPFYYDNGNAGVAWMYQITDQGGTLYLIDHNDGGWGPGSMSDATIIGSVNIVAGVNDGWQRLRLERTGGAVIGTFGGTYGSGCADGMNFSAPVAYNGPTTLFMGYREYICNNNSDCHMLLMDALSITNSSADVTYFGNAYAHSYGTPTIGVNGPPTVGNNTWALTGSSLVPNALTVFALSSTKVTVPIPGGQPGSALAILPLVTFTAPTDANGNASLPVPIACNPSFIGATVSWQIGDLDPSLPYPLPLGVSLGMDTTFGN